VKLETSYLVDFQLRVEVLSMSYIVKLFTEMLDLSFQTYTLLEREKSSTTKDMMKSVPVELLIFLEANNNLSVSFSDGTSP